MKWLCDFLSLCAALVFFCACENQAGSGMDLSQMQVGDSLVPTTPITTKRSFPEYVERIALLRAGDFYSCEEEPEPIKLLDNSYTPEGAYVLGKMRSMGSTHFIVFLYPGDPLLPVLEVYDGAGKKMEQVELFQAENCAISKDNLERSSEFTVLNEHQILIVQKQQVNEYNATIFMDTIDTYSFVR